MDRKLAATFLLSLCVVLVATSLSFAADRPYVPVENRVTLPAKWAPIYGNMGKEEIQGVSAPSPQVELGIRSANSIGVGVGNTYYDYQHNGTMGRQIEHRNTEWVHMDWMRQTGTTLGQDRRTEYNYIDLLYCTPAGQNLVHSEYGGYVNLDVWPDFSWAVPAMHAGDDANHMFPKAYWDLSTIPTPGPTNTWTYFDNPIDVYGGYQDPNWGPNGLGANEHQNIWPVVDLQTSGPDLYLHMVATESGGQAGDPQTISYYRRTGAYGAQASPAIWSGQCVIDTVEDISPHITSSTTSGKVVIAWTTPADFRRNQDAEFNGLGVQLCNDVWFAQCTDYGQTWIDNCELVVVPGSDPPVATSISIQNYIDYAAPAAVINPAVSTAPNAAYNVTWDQTGGNITQYGWEYDYKAYTNTSCLLTADDYVHILWNGRRWTDTTGIYRRQSRIFHFSNDPAASGQAPGEDPAGVIRTVAGALYDTGGTCYVGAWQSDVDKMGISECNNKLYVVWVQFGSEDFPCVDYDGEDFFLNGDLYISASDDAGFHWDDGQNITATSSPGCSCGTPPGTNPTCMCENYPTIARYGRVATSCEPLSGQHVLDVLFVEDKCAGGVVQDGRGIWTLNPVNWLTTPCRDVVPAPGMILDVTTIGECFGASPLVIDPDADTTITFTCENPGLLENVVSITLADPNDGDWLTVTPSNFTLGTGVDNFQVVELFFDAPTGAPDPSVFTCSILVSHQEDEGTTDTIPTCLLICSEFARPQYAVISTPLTRVRIWNTGEIGSRGRVPGNEGLDFIEECDTLHRNVNADRYLYSASPIITRRSGADGQSGDTLRFTSYSEIYTDVDALRPMGWETGTTRDSVVIDSTTYPDYSYARVEYSTFDTIIGLWSEYYVPKAAPTAPNGDFIVVRHSFWNMTTSDTIRDVLIGEVLDWDVPTDFRTDTTTPPSGDGVNFITGNYSNWAKLDSIIVAIDVITEEPLETDTTWGYWGPIYQQGAEVNDSLEMPACASAVNHSFRYAGILADPFTPFKNARAFENSFYIYRAGRTLEPYYMYQFMGQDHMDANNNGYPAANWAPGGGLQDFPESTFVDLSNVVTFGEYDLPPGGTGGSTNPRKFTYTVALVVTDGASSDSLQAYNDFLALCEEANDWIEAHPEIKRHCVDLPGDANNDGGINVGDQVRLVNYVFKPAACATNPPIGCPPPCLPEGDGNCDGAVNIGDAVFIGNYIFVSGSAAPCPFPPEK